MLTFPISTNAGPRRSEFFAWVFACPRRALVAEAGNLATRERAISEALGIVGLAGLATVPSIAPVDGDACDNLMPAALLGFAALRLVVFLLASANGDHTDGEK